MSGFFIAFCHFFYPVIILCSGNTLWFEFFKKLNDYGYLTCIISFNFIRITLKNCVAWMNRILGYGCVNNFSRIVMLGQYDLPG